MIIREQIATIMRCLLSEIETERTDWVEKFIETLKHEDIASEQNRYIVVKKDSVEQFTATITLSRGDWDEEEYEYDDDIWFTDEL